MLWIVLTTALIVMGACTAAWRDGLGIGGVVSTGAIDPVFISVAAGSRGEAFIDNGGKAISIFVEDVYPGDTFTFAYTVVNRGAVPVEFHTRINNSNPGLVVTNMPARGILGGNGESAAGELAILVEENGVEELATYNFYLELFFRQWSGIPR